MQLLCIEISTNAGFKRTALHIAPCSALSLAGCSESNLLPMARPAIVGRWQIHNLTHSCTSSSDWIRRDSAVIRRFSRIRPSIRAITSGANCLAVMCVLRGISSATCGYSSGTYSVRHTQQTCDDEIRGFQHLQQPRNQPHLSALLSLPPFPMLDEHTLHYAHLQSNKESIVWTCAL